jgi:dihydrofolate reductase
MKVILYMAISLDGFVAGKDDDTLWVLEEEYTEFRKMAKKLGNAIYGRRTYDLGIKDNIPPLEGAHNVVVTHNPIKDYTPYHFTNKSPKEIVNELKEKGFEEIMVSGGGEINGLFAKEGLIDEIYLDVEPSLLGEGIKLFGNEKVKLNLELLESKKFGKDTIQLHYKVIK